MVTASSTIPNSYVGIWKVHKKWILTKSRKKDTLSVLNKFMGGETKQTNQMPSLETLLSAFFGDLTVFR